MQGEINEERVEKGRRGTGGEAIVLRVDTGSPTSCLMQALRKTIHSTPSIKAGRPRQMELTMSSSAESMEEGLGREPLSSIKWMFYCSASRCNSLRQINIKFIVPLEPQEWDRWCRSQTHVKCSGGPVGNLCRRFMCTLC